MQITETVAGESSPNAVEEQDQTDQKSNLWRKIISFSSMTHTNGKRKFKRRKVNIEENFWLVSVNRRIVCLKWGNEYWNKLTRVNRQPTHTEWIED